MKRNLLLTIGVFVHTWLLAAEGSLKGKIVDENGLAMPGATIVLVNQDGLGAVTDYNGNFLLQDIPEGNYQLKVSYLGYEPIEQAIIVEPNQTKDLSISLTSGVVLDGDVFVLGDRLKGQAKAINEQRSNDNITNVVAADQIGRFPDANVGDALKRIPGITMQGDQGEARNIIIRGLAPQLNSVTINGNRIPSAEGDNRNVQMDLIPSDMIQTIQVNKAILPEMDGDAIGGSVNLVTRSASEGFRASGTMGGSYNAIGESPGFNAGMVLSNRFLNDKLGVVFSGSYRKDKIGSHNVEAEWETEVENADFDEDLPEEGNNIEDVEVGTYLATNEIRDYDVDRTRRSVSLNLDYSINEKNTIYFKSMYNWRDDIENRYRLTTEVDGAVFGNGVDAAPTEWIIVGDRQTKGGLDDDRNRNRRLEDQRMQTYSLNGEHVFGKLQLTWLGSYSKASEERPSERYVIYATEEDLTANMVTTMEDTRYPLLAINETQLLEASNFAFDKIEEENQYTSEENYTFQMDLELPASVISNQKGALKFGGKYNLRTKDRDNSFVEYAWVDDSDVAFLNQVETSDRTNSDWLVGSKYQIGDFASNSYLGGLDLSNESLFEGEDLPEEYQTANYDAEETVTAGYVQWSQNVNKQLRFITGVRIENTDFDYTGYQFVEDDGGIEEVSKSKSYDNFLPALHLRYKLNENFIVRAAWTNSLARPNYYDLVPYRYVVEEDEEIEQGNPNLDPTTSMNFDLNAEYYFESVGLISVGFFHKSIDNFVYIQQSTVDFEGNDFDALIPQNTGKGNITGFEISGQRQLDFLPGIWKGIGIYANYTYNTSDVEGIFNEDGEEREGIDLPNTADHMFNASLSFETKKLVVRASLNYSSDYIDEVGENEFYDRYYDEQLFIDLNASYAITKSWRVFAEANNLTNQPLRFYQGIESRTMQVEYYGPRYNLGVKFDLFR